MNATQEQVVPVLNHLIEVLKDGENGFRQAAEGFKDAELKTSSVRYSQQRAQFARELQDEVTQFTNKVETSGSVAAAVHRGWMGLRAALTTSTDKALIEECERGEDVAKEAYEKAISGYLPPNIAGVVQRQYASVKEVHDRFSALKKAAN